MKQKRNNRLCKTNSEALRWAKYRFATIVFTKNGEDADCCVILGKRDKSGSSLIQCVNKWIEHFNKGSGI